ncbi:MAG: hypothetical protein GX442_04785 [Candidatus Riflebacteria bacterium]|nr:hypothetical protein [Candidatus Riflebacteria bacterium]
MKTAGQWVLLLGLWAALLALDLGVRHPPSELLEAALAGSGEDSLRQALALARQHDLRLGPEAAARALDRLLALPDLPLAPADRAWYADRLGALLARSGSVTVDLVRNRLDRLASWAVPLPPADEPRSWDPLDLPGLAGAGTDPVPGLLEALTAATGPARLAAIAALGRLGTRATPAIPALEAAMAGADPRETALASDSLALIRAGLPPGR